MLQKEVPSKNLTMVGEEITHELGAKMVKDFQDAYPADITANYMVEILSKAFWPSQAV